MSKYLNYDGLSEYDRQIKAYIRGQTSGFTEHAALGSADGGFTSVTAATQGEPETWTHINNGFTTHFRNFIIPFGYCDTPSRLTTVFENRFSIDAQSATDIRFYNMLSSAHTIYATDLSSGYYTPLKEHTDIWIPAEYMRNASGTLNAFTPTILLRQNKYNSNLSVILLRGKEEDGVITTVDEDVKIRNNGDLACVIQPSREFLTNTTDWNVFALGILSFTVSDVGYRAEFDFAPMMSAAWVSGQITG